MADSALTVVPAGSATFAASTDYEKELARLNAIALDPHKVFPIDFENDEIPQGTVLNFGGIIVKAVNAVTIGGTYSKYVKVDHSTYEPDYVSEATFSGASVAWNSAYNGYYDPSGDLYLFDEASAFFDEVITDRHCIYSVLRRMVFEQVGATQPNWTTAQAVGTATSVPTMVAPSITTMIPETAIAYLDAAVEELRYYSWDWTNFTLEGSAISVSGIGSSGLAALNTTDLALIATALNQLRVYRWSGASWALRGTPLAITGLGIPALAKLTSTDVAFADDGNGQIRTYRWDTSGLTWSLVGSGLTISSMSYPALASLNSTDVAYFDAGNGELRLYRWSGSAWSLVGSGLTIPDTANKSALTRLTETDVAFINNDVFRLETYRWDNIAQEWSKINGLTTISVTAPAMTTLSSTEIVIAEQNGASVRTYHIYNEPKAIT